MKRSTNDAFSVDFIELLRIDASVQSVGLERALIAGKASGLEIVARGQTVLESAEPPLHLLFHLESVLEYVGLYVTVRIVDGAIGEVGAQATQVLQEALRRIPKAARKFSEITKERRTSVSIFAKHEDGLKRWYPLSLEDIDEQTRAILEDLQVPIYEFGNEHRGWLNGTWVGMADYWRQRSGDRKGSNEP